MRTPGRELRPGALYLGGADDARGRWDGLFGGIMLAGEQVMTLHISLPPETEAKLRQRADAAGRDVAGYVEELIERDLTKPRSLLEAAEPFARAVEAAGVGDEELKQILTEARDEVREARRHRKPA